MSASESTAATTFEEAPRKSIVTHKERRERRKLLAQMVKNGRTVAEAAQVYECTIRQAQLACAEFGIAIEGGVAVKPSRTGNAKRRTSAA